MYLCLTITTLHLVGVIVLTVLCITNRGHLTSAANAVLRLIIFSLAFLLTAIIFGLMLDQQAKIVQILAGVYFVLVYHMKLYLSFNAIINLK